MFASRNMYIKVVSAFVFIDLIISKITYTLGANTAPVHTKIALKIK